MDLYDNFSSSDDEIDLEPPCIAPEIQEQDDDDVTIDAGNYLKEFCNECPSMRYTNSMDLGHIVTAESVPILSMAIDPVVKEQLLNTLLSLHLPRMRCKCILQLVSDARRKYYCTSARFR